MADEVDGPTRITELIEALGDWRGETLGAVRGVITDVVPGVVEAWKYRGAPVWEHHGQLCTGGAFKKHVKITFTNGAALDDVDGLFNNGLDGGKWRAIDFHEGDAVDREALGRLLRRAAAFNESKR